MIGDVITIVVIVALLCMIGWLVYVLWQTLNDGLSR